MSSAQAGLPKLQLDRQRSENRPHETGVQLDVSMVCTQVYVATPRTQHTPHKSHTPYLHENVYTYIFVDTITYALHTNTHSSHVDSCGSVSTVNFWFVRLCCDHFPCTPVSQPSACTLFLPSSVLIKRYVNAGCVSCKLSDLECFLEFVFVSVLRRRSTADDAYACVLRALQ